MAPYQAILKKNICIGLLWLFPAFLLAQTEFGLLTSNLQDFHGVYKKMAKDQSYFRLRVGIIEADIDKQQTTVNTSARLFFAFGWEKRVPIRENLFLYTGPEPRLSLSHARNSDLPSARLGFGLGYIFGLKHFLNPSISLNVEFIPNINVHWNWVNRELRSNSLGFTFNTTSLSIEASYQISSVAKPALKE